MNEFLHIGFDAYVNAGKILLIMQADADKVRREMKKGILKRHLRHFGTQRMEKRPSRFCCLKMRRWLYPASLPRRL